MGDTFTKEKIIKLIEPHKEQLNQPSRFWNEYAKKHQLPTLWIIKKFMTYQELRESLGIQPYSRMKYTDEELKEMVRKHKKGFDLSTNDIHEYLKQHKLPTLPTFTKRLGNLDTLRRIAGLNYHYKKLYSEEDLIEVARKHKDAFEKPIDQIQDYLAEHDLPRLKTFTDRFGSIHEVRRLCGATFDSTTPSRVNVIQIAKEHKEQILKGEAHWDAYAEKHNLPNTVTMRQPFGNWNKLQYILLTGQS